VGFDLVGVAYWILTLQILKRYTNFNPQFGAVFSKSFMTLGYA